MWTIVYKGHYVQGNFGTKECVVLFSRTGYGYEKRILCKSLQAAKIAITRTIRENAQQTTKNIKERTNA